MKKRVKLLTTIASLCLAVALMAFGVYAATNITATVTNTVSFTATENVKATLTYSTSLTNATLEEGAAYTNKTDEEWAVLVGKPTEEVDVLPLGDLTFEQTSEANIVYTYTITITNNAKAGDAFQYLLVELTTDPTDPGTDYGYTVVVEGAFASTTKAIVNPGDASINYTVKITINPALAYPATPVDLGSAIKLSAQKTATSA